MDDNYNKYHDILSTLSARLIGEMANTILGALTPPLRKQPADTDFLANLYKADPTLKTVPATVWDTVAARYSLGGKLSHDERVALLKHIAVYRILGNPAPTQD